MKTTIFFLPLIFQLFFISCSNPIDGGKFPVHNVFQTPIVTGLRITGINSPEVISVWGTPSDSPDNSNNLLKSNSDRIPTGYKMFVPYPNPNDGATVITFTLPIVSKVSLWIFRARYIDDQNLDINISDGAFCIASSIRPVKQFYKNYTLQAGNHRIMWDGRDDSNSSVASGFFRVYFSVGDNFVYKDIFLYRALEDIPPSLRKLIHPDIPLIKKEI